MFVGVFLLILSAQFSKPQYTAICPSFQFEDCKWIYPAHVTQNLRCDRNYKCPPNFLCCPDCHYLHKVCKAAIWVPEVPSQNDNNKRCPASPQFCPVGIWKLSPQNFWCNSDGDCNEGLICCSDNCFGHNICKSPTDSNDDWCPEDSKSCTQPFSYEESKNYECFLHEQCHKDHYCCPDSCYRHKICKPKWSTQKCPLSVRRKSCPNSSRTLKKYGCVNGDDCIFGYICCEDNCYDHKVCKLPNDAFTYRQIYKPINATIPKTFEEQHRCPDVKGKCLVPYSMRLAKKFICFKDEDCKLGQLCCKDSCVKDFKICKDVFKVDLETVNAAIGISTQTNSLETTTVSPHEVNVTKSHESLVDSSANKHSEEEELSVEVTFKDLSNDMKFANTGESSESETTTTFGQYIKTLSAKQNNCDGFIDQCYAPINGSEPQKQPIHPNTAEHEEFSFEGSAELTVSNEEAIESEFGSGYLFNDSED